MAWPSGREELIEVQLKIASQVAAPWSLPAGWSTTPDRASELVQRCLGRGRTPEPLRRAREAARLARQESMQTSSRGLDG